MAKVSRTPGSALAAWAMRRMTGLGSFEGGGVGELHDGDQVAAVLRAG
jgi:hypothetical protein